MNVARIAALLTLALVGCDNGTAPAPEPGLPGLYYMVEVNGVATPAALPGNVNVIGGSLVLREYGAWSLSYTFGEPHNFTNGDEGSYEVSGNDLTLFSDRFDREFAATVNGDRVRMEYVSDDVYVFERAD